MFKLHLYIGLLLCLMLACLGSSAGYAEEISSEDTWQQELDPGIGPVLPATNYVAIINFLNAPLLLESFEGFIPTTENLIHHDPYTFLTSDLPPPVL